MFALTFKEGLQAVKTVFFYNDMALDHQSQEFHFYDFQCECLRLVYKKIGTMLIIINCAFSSKVIKLL